MPELQRDAPDDVLDSETVLARFNRLVQDLLRGSIRRNTFLPWEVDLMLDIEQCPLRDGPLRRELQRYQAAVRRHMSKGERVPLKFSEYMSSRSSNEDLKSPSLS
jgi:hypothetical protein